jgi:hypothetical protein
MDSFPVAPIASAHRYVSFSNVSFRQIASAHEIFLIPKILFAMQSGIVCDWF